MFSDLLKFISIQSVSTDSKRFPEILKAAEFLETKLKKLGFSVKFYQKPKTPPLVVATRIISTQTKTIGIYAHYDVQPEDPADEWESPPFLLTKRGKKLYGRGVADDKGHVIQIINATKHLIEQKELKNNLVLLFEGEEESGSVNFEEYVKEAKETLSKVDVFYVFDMGMFATGIPQIEYGLRGLIDFELLLQTGIRDLHSGSYGNRVLNPANVLADLFSQMKDGATNKVLIPGFYDKVRSLDKKERLLLGGAERSGTAQKEEAGVFAVVDLDKIQPSLSAKILPSLDINGIISGYTGEGSKTIIPKEARVKFSVRLVEYQDPDATRSLITNFIKKHLPEGVKYSIKIYSQAAFFYTDVNNEYIQKTAKILAKVFKNATRFNRSGGSVPAAELVQRIFKKPVVLTGFISPDSHIHSPDENIDAEMFSKGTRAIEEILVNI